MSIGESPTAGREFIARFGLEIPFVIDANGAVANAYGLVSTPTTYVIDREGRLVDEREGLISQGWIDGTLSTIGG